MAQTDTELIIKARIGDVAAFEALIFRYDKKVFTIAAQFVHCAEDAKDIYQEVLIRVYNALPSFKFKSEFSTWLYRITTNVCLTHITDRNKHHTNTHCHLDGGANGTDDPLHAMASDDPTPDEQYMEREQSDRLQGALTALSPNQRMIVILKHYQGYKLREIAEIMGSSEGTVKKHLFTAMQRLRIVLHDTGKEG